MSNEKLVKALEIARNGLRWYQDRYPSEVNGCDDEAMATIDAALQAHAAEAAQAQAGDGVTDDVVARACVQWNKAAGLAYAVADRDCMRAALLSVWPVAADAAQAYSMEAIRGAVARGWCAPVNERKVMDADLAEAIAREVSAMLAAAPQPQAAEPVALLHCCGSDSRTGIEVSHGNMREWDRLLADRRVLDSGVPVYLYPQPAQDAKDAARYSTGDRVTWTNRFGTSFNGEIREHNPETYGIELDDGTYVDRAFPDDIHCAMAKESGR